MLKTIYNKESTHTYRLYMTNEYNIPIALNTDNIVHVWNDRFEDVVRFFNENST